MIICPSKPEETPKDVIFKKNRQGVLGHDDVDFFDQEYLFAKEESKPSGTDLPLERDPELDEDLNFVIRDSSDHEGDPMDHVSQEDEYLSEKEDISEDGKNNHKEISNGIKEAYHCDEDFCPDNELENGSSQGEEESQYESKYIAEIATLKASCGGDISNKRRVQIKESACPEPSISSNFAEENTYSKDEEKLNSVPEIESVDKADSDVKTEIKLEHNKTKIGCEFGIREAPLEGYSSSRNLTEHECFEDMKSLKSEGNSPGLATN